MKHGITFIQKLCRQRLARETDFALAELVRQTNADEEAASQRLVQMGTGKNAILLGHGAQGQVFKLPADKLIAHALILGASGAGKSYLALWLILSLLGQPTPQAAFGILDAKGELFDLACRYLYADLYRLPEAGRAALRGRVTIIDFSDEAVVTPYNILARRPGVSDEILTAGRIELLSAQFSGNAELSVRMKLILKYFFLLMEEFELPLPYFERLCTDPLLLRALVGRSSNRQVRDYFMHRYESEPDSTVLAIRQRIDSLLVSEGVRLSLSAQTTPDFAQLQDNGSIILINTAGRSITRGISELLQGLVLSDIRQGVFARRHPGRRFLWLFDEAQNLYKTTAGREHMVDLLTMARSFGSFFVLMTQSLTSAVRDADVLNSILANVRWMLMLRSTLRDGELIAPALPLTGRRRKPARDPFEPVKLMTEHEELKAKLKEITHLPDRQGYLWLKAHMETAVRMQTPLVPQPHEIAGCSPAELEEFARSEPLGQGVPRQEICTHIERQERRLSELLLGQTVPAPAERNARDGRSQHSLITQLEAGYAKRK